MKSAHFPSRRSARLPVLVVCGLMLGACQSFRTPGQDGSSLSATQTQLEQRDYQTRAFDTADQEQTLRVVIATLQDLGFALDQANAQLGAVSASRTGRRPMRITVTVRPRGTAQVLVRANLYSKRAPITDPRRYQEFFAALEQAIFLKAHDVD